MRRSQFVCEKTTYTNVMPLVSVIMPCFNHALFVGESIEAILAQSVADLELIIVDDCSRDDSRTVIERYAGADRRVRALYHDRKLGASRSRNHRIRTAPTRLFPVV